MAAESKTITSRVGYGQVEVVQMQFSGTRAFYNSLPVDKEIPVIENGMFLYYDQLNKSINAGKTADLDNGVYATNAPLFMVYNELKNSQGRTGIAEARRFCQKPVGDDNYTFGDSDSSMNLGTSIYGQGFDNTEPNPSVETLDQIMGRNNRLSGFSTRLVGTFVGDIFNTNQIALGVQYTLGDVLVPQLDSTKKAFILTKKANPVADDQQYVVVAFDKLADGQDCVRLQRVK